MAGRGRSKCSGMLTMRVIRFEQNVWSIMKASGRDKIRILSVKITSISFKN